MSNITWQEIAPHPMVTVVLGDINSGKTATACSLLNYYHNKKIKCNIIAPKEVHEQYVKTAPWLGRVNPETLKVPLNTANLIDDVHLMYSARKWYKNINTILDNLNRESRHKNCSFIYTTQQSTVADRNIISVIGCLVIKCPSIMQKESERPFVRKIMNKADKAFKKIKVKDWKEYQKHAYIISRHLPEPKLLSNLPLVDWWSNDISRAYRNVDLRMKRPKINIRKFKLMRESEITI